MKIGKKTLIVLGMFYLVRILASCDPCRNYSAYYYHFDELTVSNLDNSGKTAELSQATEINKNAFGINIKISTKPASSWFRPNFFNNTAFAWECDDGDYSEDVVEDIKIFTLNDFNSGFPAGSDVSRLFRVQLHSVFRQLDQHLSYINSISRVLNENKSLEIQSLLLTSPDYEGPHQFEIEVHFQDDSILTAITTPVLLK